jgi:threonine synthase
MATNGTANGAADDTHTPSQRYLSTRGEDTGV